jgi:multicomponent Na+:H+ antiporter subunit E
MRFLLYNFVLAIAGVWLIEYYVDLDLSKPLIFISAFSVVFLGVWLSTYIFNRRYFFKFPKLIRYILFIIKELFVSSFRVAYDVLTPMHRMNPAIIAIPLDAKTDREIVTLATLITFTPGTLSLAISEDRKTLYVHEMYVPNNDIAASRKKIKEGFEKRLLELTR